VPVEDRVELAVRVEVADREVVRRFLAALAGLGPDIGDRTEVGVRVRRLARRAGSGGRERGVDRTEATLPRVGWRAPRSARS